MINPAWNSSSLRDQDCDPPVRGVRDTHCTFNHVAKLAECHRSVSREGCLRRFRGARGHSAATVPGVAWPGAESGDDGPRRLASRRVGEPGSTGVDDGTRHRDEGSAREFAGRLNHGSTVASADPEPETRLRTSSSNESAVSLHPPVDGAAGRRGRARGRDGAEGARLRPGGSADETDPLPSTLCLTLALLLRRPRSGR